MTFLGYLVFSCSETLRMQEITLRLQRFETAMTSYIPHIDTFLRKILEDMLAERQSFKKGEICDSVSIYARGGAGGKYATIVPRIFVELLFYQCQ